MKNNLQHVSLHMVIAALLCVTAAVQAAAPVSMEFDGAGLQAVTNADHGSASMRISGPNGYHIQKRGAAASSLRAEGGLADGLYKYEVTLEPATKRKRKGAQEETVGRTRRNVTSGYFRVVNGAIIDPNVKESSGGRE